MQSQDMVLTDAAAAKVRKLRATENNQDLLLRVYITGGGCAGFSYGFTFDEAAKDDDSVFVNGDVRMVVDPLSFQYLAGAQVDYSEGLQGSRFIVNNPNAQSTCGCGSSFSV